MVKLTMANNLNWRALAVIALFAFGMPGSSTHAATVSDVRTTAHNLSKSGTGPVKATSETQVCVFCHTPHGANASAKVPLWNRRGQTLQTYTPYSSSSLDATIAKDPLNGVTGGSSVLCLSCHDGVIALGNVNVLAGKSYSPDASPPTIALTNSGGAVTTMPTGSGATTGYTRNLGTDLRNDHPISITYDDTLAGADGEMALPSTHASVMGIRSSTNKPLLPLEPTGTAGAAQVQCATCHDPHITKEKFLRLNRYQSTNGPTGTFNATNDIICLACHEKLGATWAQSAHANTTDAAYVYKDDASIVRGFPTGANAKKVWEVACLNCHDTHTVSGSRRLLREGTGSAPNATSAAFQLGVTAASLDQVSSIENTCYQCHNTPNTSGGADTVGATILKGTTLTATAGVPDIKSEFDRLYHMPIKTSEQIGTGNANDKEVHDITDADFTESQTKLGRGAPTNRHAECTDCHNPHRVIKNTLFNGQGLTTQRTHVPSGSGGNIASGVLRGAWGVEPNYVGVTVSGSGSTVTGSVWPENPTLAEKKGDPKTSISTARSETYLTREYQLCFKCHSNYANSDSAANFPSLGNTGGGTASGTNGIRNYTNVAAEFAVRATDPPTSGLDQGESGNAGSACGGDCAPAGSYPRDLNSGNGAVNHRSWHPVVFPTGRDRAERGSSSWNNLRAPFSKADAGKLTMQCSDCHGSSQSWTQGDNLAGTGIVGGPNLTQVQGPHGSGNPFLLKGVWTTSVNPGSAAGTNSSNSICGRCHDPKNAVSGFASGDASHSFEGKVGRYCTACHIAVPHGWKNKAFLVNLNCVQSEGGTWGTTTFGSTCTAIGGIGGTSKVDIPPYYYQAVLRIKTWAKSANWSQSSCDSSDWMSSACGY